MSFSVFGAFGSRFLRAFFGRSTGGSSGSSIVGTGAPEASVGTSS